MLICVYNSCFRPRVNENQPTAVSASIRLAVPAFKEIGSECRCWRCFAVVFWRSTSSGLAPWFSVERAGVFWYTSKSTTLVWVDSSPYGGIIQSFGSSILNNAALSYLEYTYIPTDVIHERKSQPWNDSCSDKMSQWKCGLVMGNPAEQILGLGKSNNTWTGVHFKMHII